VVYEAIFLNPIKKHLKRYNTRHLSFLSGMFKGLAR
jgi:hypothetical protein